MKTREMKPRVVIDLFSVLLQTVTNVLGPDIHTKTIGKVHLLEFAPAGVFGWIPTDGRMVSRFLSGDFRVEAWRLPSRSCHALTSSLYWTQVLSAAPVPGRGETQVTVLPMWPSFHASPTPSSACPLATCSFLLLPSTTRVLRVRPRVTRRSCDGLLTWVRFPPDRRASHFPVYQKDHLFNSNPGWDFGAFRRLEALVKQTDFTSTRSPNVPAEQEKSQTRIVVFSPPRSSPSLRFAHVFSERGKYVFVDAAVPERSAVVVVSEEGTECRARASAFQPMTPAQLVRHGIVKQHRLNFLPDWGVIVGPYRRRRPAAVSVSCPLGLRNCEKIFCRRPESAAGCRGGGDHHGVGSATRQGQTCFPAEDKAKVAPCWGAVVSVQQRRVHLLSMCE